MLFMHRRAPASLTGDRAASDSSDEFQLYNDNDDNGSLT
jgi:hypothetical protein